jgi:hypothetical protein
VRACVEVPAPSAADAQVNVWMDREDGMRVLEGTASVGSPEEPSMLRRKVAEPREAGRCAWAPGAGRRWLAGEGAPSGRARGEAEAGRDHGAAGLVLRCVAVGGPVVNPGLLVHLMAQAQRRMALLADAVGLRAIECGTWRGRSSRSASTR